MQVCRLSANNLACQRGERLLFRGLALELGPGQALQVKGANGIGKLILYHTVEDQFLTSVERLRKVPVSVVHGGHYASFGRKRYTDIIDDYIARKRSPGCPAEARMAKKG